MRITTLTSREFDQDASRAKKAANKGPVLITDRGNPAYVLVSIIDYRKLTGSQGTVVDLLAMPGLADIDFEPPRINGSFSHPADVS